MPTEKQIAVSDNNARRHTKQGRLDHAYNTNEPNLPQVENWANQHNPWSLFDLFRLGKIGFVWVRFWPKLGFDRLPVRAIFQTKWTQRRKNTKQA
jgi:hypothetical protein